MLSKRTPHNTLITAVFFLLLAPAQAAADVVVERDETIYGRITEATEDHVSIQRGCDPKNVKTIPKSRVRYMKIDGDCNPHSVSVPDNVECFRAKRFFLVRFVGQNEGTVVRDVRLDRNKNQDISLKLAMNWGTLEGPVDKVASIASVCINDPEKETNQFWAPQSFRFKESGVAWRSATAPGPDK